VENKSISAYDPMNAGMGNDFDENDTLGETDRRVRIKEFGSESSCDTVQRYTASSEIYKPWKEYPLT
jgi:hypothetical protein